MRASSDRRLGLAAAVLSILFTAGCGRTIERAAESRLNGMLPELLGPADRYATRVRGGGSLLRGRAEGVHIDGFGVRVTEGLTLDTVALDLDDVEADRKTGRLTRVGSVAFAATLGERSLTRYVQSRQLGIPDLRVNLETSAVRVTARPEALGIASVPVTVRGTLTPTGDGNRLDFTPSAARVSIVPVPGAVLRYLSERLNPVVDLSSLRVPVRVADAEVRGGVLHLRGSVDPDVVLRLSARAFSSGRGGDTAP
jgi:hypothetical protein